MLKKRGYVGFAAYLLQISRFKTYQLINEGKLPSTSIGASIRAPMSALKELPWISDAPAEDQAEKWALTRLRT